MATSSINQIKGLETFANSIDPSAGSAQTIASNVVIDRDNILEPRRGIKVLADLPEKAKQLLTYKDRVLAHYGNSLGYLNTSDPGFLTPLKGFSSFTITGTTTAIKVIDHALSVGDALFFSKQQDLANPGTFFTFPTGIDEVSQYFVHSIIDKDNFRIAASTVGAAITLSGTSSKALVSYDFVVNEVKSNLRLKYIELNSSLFLTTSTGIKKVSQLSPFAISKAGGVNALNLDLSLNFTGSGGYFGPQDPSPLDVEVAYRLVWGTKDVNGTLLLGKPSERAFIQNYTRQNADVDLSFTVPQGVDSTYFYQIYRTNIFTIGGSGDEMRLVFEANYDGFSSVVTITDSTPEVIRDTGVPLYTNELSGEGILQANDRPPVCEDVTVFKDRAWFANTKSSQKLDVTFLGFDGFRDPIDAPSATGNPAVITLGIDHDVTVGSLVAIANSTSVDGQYTVTAITSTTITVNLDSSNLGANYVLYRTYVTIEKGSQTSSYFFVGKPETTRIVCNTTAATTAQDYFNITSIDDKIKYTYWFAKASTDVAPIVPNRVLFKVDLYTAPVPVTDSQVRDRIKEAIDISGDFLSLNGVPTGELNISTITSGAVTDAASATQSGTSLISIVKTQDGFGENPALNFARLSAYASPASAIEDTTKSLVKLIISNPDSPVYAYYLASLTSLPGQLYLEEKNFSEQSFTIKGNGFLSDVSFNPNLTVTAVKSSNNVGNNVLMFSKVQQPEAVPVVNSFRIGPQDKAIKRILGLRDSLFIFKEEGVYRLTGESESTFNIALFDNSATIIAPDSAVILNNQIYCITTQGVSSISETGVGVISRSIENIFNTVSSENYTNFATATFGVAYEADRSYLLFTVSEETDTVATIAYRFNSFTRTWTSFDKSAVCGVVNLKNKLHLGSSDINAVEVERKKISSRDYVDREYTRTISALSGNKLYIDSAADIEIGDSVTQKQYLSVSEFNNLVGRLKLEPSLNFDPNFAKLTETGGADLVDATLDLAIELNTKDTSRYATTFSSASANIINVPSHEFLENDTVLFTNPTPVSLVNNTYYRVVNVVGDNFQLTNITPNVFIQTLSTLGTGVITSTSKVLNFNLVRDIDYVSSFIIFPDHGLVDGDLVTYTNGTSPIVGVPPTGLVDSRQYRVINSASNQFQLVEYFVDLANTENGSLQEVYYFSGVLDNKKTQRDFNYVVDQLNNSSLMFFSNYETSVGFEELDMIVTEVNLSQNYVVTQYKSASILGDVTHYKSIKSEIEWELFTLGDPSMLKHVTDATLMLEQNSLNDLTFGFATDLSGDFEDVVFQLDGDGNFGKAPFGETAFGGNGTSYPLRTLIPRQKQRCRHIRCRVAHSSAFMKYNILGISYVYSVTGDRAYRR